MFGNDPFRLFKSKLLLKSEGYKVWTAARNLLIWPLLFMQFFAEKLLGTNHRAKCSFQYPWESPKNRTHFWSTYNQKYARTLVLKYTVWMQYEKWWLNVFRWRHAVQIVPQQVSITSDTKILSMWMCVVCVSPPLEYDIWHMEPQFESGRDYYYPINYTLPALSRTIVFDAMRDAICGSTWWSQYRWSLEKWTNKTGTEHDDYDDWAKIQTMCCGHICSRLCISREKCWFYRWCIPCALRRCVFVWSGPSEDN